MRTKRKVIIFVNSYAGGAEKMTLNIAQFLELEAFEVIYCIIGKDLGLIAQFIPENAVVRFIKVSSYKDNLIFKIYKFLRVEKPDVVFASLMPINWRLCLASAFMPRVKVILRINNYLYTQSFIQKLRLFFSYRFADKIIVQTEEMKIEHTSILKLKSDKVVTLPNPINKVAIDKKIAVILESPFSNDNSNYVFAGRISYVKGLDVLFEAFSEILKVRPNSILHIIGNTQGIFESYYLELIQLAKLLGITERVVFLGFQSNPYGYMKYADCLVLPSRNEGLPNVIIEALYLGTPVAVTASVPVVSRIVRNGVDGFVVPVDDPNKLANAMNEAADIKDVKSGYKSATSEDFRNLFIE